MVSTWEFIRMEIRPQVIFDRSQPCKSEPKHYKGLINNKAAPFSASVLRSEEPAFALWVRVRGCVCVCVCVCPLGHSTATRDSDYKDKCRRANHAQMYVCTHKYPVFEIF